METTRAADFRFELGESREPGGLEDYAGEFRPSLRLEDFSHAVLVRQVKEFLLDIHLRCARATPTSMTLRIRHTRRPRSAGPGRHDAHGGATPP